MLTDWPTLSRDIFVRESRVVSFCDMTPYILIEILTASLLNVEEFKNWNIHNASYKLTVLSNHY